MELYSELRFLCGLAEAVVEASRVRPEERVANSGPNTSGGTLIRPGGRDDYPAFWIRDFSMSVESGLITAAELEHALLTTAKHQQAEDWQLPSGSFVPRGAIPDGDYKQNPIYMASLTGPWAAFNRLGWTK